jgi:hypothetical protein
VLETCSDFIDKRRRNCPGSLAYLVWRLPHFAGWRQHCQGDPAPNGFRSGEAARPCIVAEQSHQVISLALTSPEEMFVLAPADLFSEYRNFMTGLEYCISVLRSRRSKGPVRIKLALPADRVAEGLDQRIVGTLNRYCEHRIAYNLRERRAVRLDGLFSLWIGLPIVVLGFLLVIIKSSIVGSTGNANLVIDSGGWVLVWVGLWFPLDTLLFTPLSYGRENRVLKRLRTAEVAIESHPTIKNV